MRRPECFEFAMDFLGDPEAAKLLAYIEALEARVALLTSHVCALTMTSKGYPKAGAAEDAARAVVPYDPDS